MTKKIFDKRCPELSDNLNRIMVLCGLKQGELARVLKVSQSSLSEWISGVSEPSRGAFMLICEKFGVTPDTLGYGTVEFCTLNGRVYGEPPSSNKTGTPEPEEIEIAAWLKELHDRWKPKPLAAFYGNLAVEQQSWSNYERNETTIPAWVVVRAVRAYGTTADDLRWWFGLASAPIPEGADKHAGSTEFTRDQVAQMLRDALAAFKSLSEKEGTPDVRGD